MKTSIILLLSLFSFSALAGMKCVGTTVIFHDDGNAESIDVPLEKIEGEKNFAVYYGESSVFKFWAEHDGDVIVLEILDKKDVLVVNNPKMLVARFNVSIASYWKTYFASLNCTPTQN